MCDNVSAFHAEEYDENIKKTLPYYELFYQQVIELVKVSFQTPVTWLDVGCGTGKMAEVAFTNMDIQTFEFCDNSDHMIDIVRKRFIGKPAVFTKASILDIQPQSQYDVITAIQVFHYLQKEERIQAIRKCFNALTQHGVFITFENFAPYSEMGKHVMLERWKTYQMAQGKDEEASMQHIHRYGTAYFPITISDHLDVLKQCGFQQVEVIWVSNMQVGLMGIKEL